CLVFHFFFQAEDGIRDFHVTGVQTCALPIWPAERIDAPADRLDLAKLAVDEALAAEAGIDAHHQHEIDLLEQVIERPGGGRRIRSEERRVGKEGRERWWACRQRKQESVRCHS